MCSAPRSENRVKTWHFVTEWSTIVFWGHFPSGSWDKIRTWNWKLAGQAVSNCKYEFSNTCLPRLPPQDTRTCPRELVFKSPRCSLGVLLGATTTSRHRGSRRIPYENAQNPSEEHDSMHAPARIPSDPVRIPSQKMHQTQAKIIIHDIAPPRIPSDPASDPVCFAGSQRK